MGKPVMYKIIGKSGMCETKRRDIYFNRDDDEDSFQNFTSHIQCTGRIEARLQQIEEHTGGEDWKTIYKDNFKRSMTINKEQKLCL